MLFQNLAFILSSILLFLLKRMLLVSLKMTFIENEAVLLSLTLREQARAFAVTIKCITFAFFSIRVFFHNHLRTTGLQGKGEGISLTPHYYFHSLHRHLDISWAITADSSPLHIDSSQTQTGSL